MPLQCEIGVKVEPLQVAVPHETLVPPSWQWPTPSQVPVLPQGGLRRAAGRAARGCWPARWRSCPGLLARLQAWQVRARARAAADAVDAAVAGQAVAGHRAGLAEPLLVAAEVGQRVADVGRQAVGVRRAGRLAGVAGSVADVRRAAERRRPPGRCRCRRRCGRWSASSPCAGRTGAAHDVPPAYCRQAPLPSQNPSVPQLVLPLIAAGRLRVGRCRSGRCVQVPRRGRERARLAGAGAGGGAADALRADSRSCTRRPSRRPAPAALRPHEPFVQTAGDAQSASAVQEALQTRSSPQRYGEAGGRGRGDAVAGAVAGRRRREGRRPAAGSSTPCTGSPCAYCWQAPASHLPFVPQEVGRLVGAQAGGIDLVARDVGAGAERWSAARTTGRRRCRRACSRRPARREPRLHSFGVEHDGADALEPHELPRCSVLGVMHCVAGRADVEALACRCRRTGAQGSESGATHWPVALQVDWPRVDAARAGLSAQVVPAAYVSQLAAAVALAVRPARRRRRGPGRCRADRRCRRATGHAACRARSAGRSTDRRRRRRSSQQTPSTQKLDAHSRGRGADGAGRLRAAGCR